MAEYQSTYTGAEIDAGIGKANTAVQPADLSSKQDTLVSGTNIKTINGNSILGSGNIATGINYSTTEQNTGLKWIDGRDIYQKTFAGTSIPSNNYNIEHGISNFGKLIHAYGSAHFSDNDYCRPIPFVYGAQSTQMTWFCGLAVTDIYLIVQSGDNFRLTLDSYSITILYTKEAPLE